MKKYFATLDVGTSMIKGMVWDNLGHCHFLYKENSPSLQLNGLYAEQDIQLFYRKIILTLQQLNSFISFKQCAGLAIATQRNTFIPLNDEQHELSALVSWLDRRKYQVHGDRLDWFSKNFSSFKNIKYIRSLMSWLCEKLTGKACETASTAPTEWLIAPQKYPSITGPDLTLPGSVLIAKPNEKSLRTVIPDGLPIIIGAGDKDCALLAGQAHHPSRAVLCSGTAISIGKFLKIKTSLPKRDDIYFSPTNFLDQMPVEAGLPFGGGVLNWLTTTYQLDVLSLPSALPNINSTVFCVPPVFSHAGNTDWYPKFVGNNTMTNKNLLITAAIEGVILELIRCKLALESFGESINEVMMGGSHQWLVKHAAWLANALQCQIKQVENLELTSRGLAMLALSVIEKNQDYFLFAERFHDEIITFYPQAASVRHWQKRFQLYKEHGCHATKKN